MFIDASLLPFGLNLLLWSVLIVTCCAAALTADWRALAEDPSRIHLLLGGALFCLVLWLMSVRVIENLWIHLLGMTTLTLILGWRFAILAGTLSSLVYALLIQQPIAAMAAAWLLSVAIPASVSRYLVYSLRRLKRQNLFIYMLGAGFGGGILSALAVAVSTMLLFLIIGQTSWVEDALGNWPVISLMLFPEGFINGMIVTTLTVFYPGLVKTFDESFYLDGR
jgi:uncharacterized membrane protein